MNKRILIGLILFLFVLGLLVIWVFAYDHKLHERQELMNPNHFSSYSNKGIYQFDPESILTSLDRGKTDVFTPLLEDLDLVEEPTDVPISWKQADFLKIASALGQSVWEDPMDLEDWNVYSVSFSGDCENDMGFNLSSITYFKMVEKNYYTTRFINVIAYLGVVKWGSDATYSRPIIDRWDSVDLAGSNISADDAQQIAEDNGGKEFRSQVDNICSFRVGSPYFNKNGKWRLSYGSDFNMYIDFYTGEYELLNTDQ
jgi:hypothetical protein